MISKEPVATESAPARGNTNGIVWVYLIAITAAEVITTFVNPVAGVIIHGMLLVLLIVHATRVWHEPVHELLLSLSIAPLIRILSLTLPLTQFALIQWFVLTSIPLFLTAFIIIRLLNLRREEIGLRVGDLPVQLLIALLGFGLGVMEYVILHPQPLIPALTLDALWGAAVILLVCTGFAEELFFRGLLQRTAYAALGRLGIVYVAALFAVLHIGYQSLLDVAFVFGVGLLFGYLVLSTRSLLGVTLAHGLTNILLFLVLPHLR
jgi:membrane protease YdiL (CAAX protease family)